MLHLSRVCPQRVHGCIASNSRDSRTTFTRRGFVGGRTIVDPQYRGAVSARRRNQARDLLDERVISADMDTGRSRCLISIGADINDKPSGGSTPGWCLHRFGWWESVLEAPSPIANASPFHCPSHPLARNLRSLLTRPGEPSVEMIPRIIGGLDRHRVFRPSNELCREHTIGGGSLGPSRCLRRVPPGGRIFGVDSDMRLPRS